MNTCCQQEERETTRTEKRETQELQLTSSHSLWWNQLKTKDDIGSLKISAEED